MHVEQIFIKGIWRNWTPIAFASFCLIFISFKFQVYLRSVWPDVGMKSSQIVSKSCPKVLLHKSDLFENSPNHPHIFWVTFVVYFSPRTLKNRPIWSHCQWCTLLFEPSINADASFALVWRSPLRSSNLCTLSCLILSLSHGYSVTLPCLTLSCFILSLYHLNSSTLLSTIFLSTMF